MSETTTEHSSPKTKRSSPGRDLDKLIDELAKGKKMASILRQ
jgi:hypothetical protein